LQAHILIEHQVYNFLLPFCQPHQRLPKRIEPCRFIQAATTVRMLNG
jgi:hypothetical protein